MDFKLDRPARTSNGCHLVNKTIIFSAAKSISNLWWLVSTLSPQGRRYDFPHYLWRPMAARIFHGALLNITQHKLIFHFNCSYGKHKWRCWDGNIRAALDRECFGFECRGSQENTYSSETVSVCFLIHSFHYKRHGVILINAFIVNAWWMGLYVHSGPFTL